MPILKILIDDEEAEFRILPINRKIWFRIIGKYTDIDGIVDRPGFLSYVVKEPKMTKMDWSRLPVSMITKIMRNIDYYIDSIIEKEKELRTLYVQINVYEDELDDLLRFITDKGDDWAWDRVKEIENNISGLEEKKNQIEKSLESLKEDKVIFEEGKEIDYDVQLLQLDYNKKKE